VDEGGHTEGVMEGECSGCILYSCVKIEQFPVETALSRAGGMRKNDGGVRSN
jgi:hypothetical protein